MADLLEQAKKDAAAGKSLDGAASDVYQQSIKQIDRYQNLVAVFDCLKDGVSRGSILILMALGLAIIFGQMGVTGIRSAAN